MTLTTQQIVVPDLDTLPITVDELDDADTPEWDALTARYADIQAMPESAEVVR